ncbi:MAG: CHAP domain-containing protein [Segetibacter sp.]
MPAKPSIDQVAATNLAADLAEAGDLPVSSNVKNQAISLQAKSELSQNSDNAISKPQIIQPTTAVARGVTSYKAHTGDTVDSLAKKFKLTKNTIKWSNAMQSDAIEPGRQVTISPVDGIVSTAHSGDTVASLAKKYKTNPERIILYNDVKPSAAIKAGTKVVVPGGTKADNSTADDSSLAQPVVDNQASVFGSPSSPVNVSALLAGGNQYDYGYCTWYVYNRRAALGKPIGGLWGNASSWTALARGSGFNVNSTPSIGSVLQTPNAAGGYGHVAVVESVHSNGSLTISEMNFSGWGVRDTRRIPASQASSYNYIH